ncbi:hypothetical protein TNCV_1276201 [Trichonephila clavipes]|nr:hypothetical protein TNCV_1276201 [Trichonephila clavipes]
MVRKKAYVYKEETTLSTSKAGVYSRVTENIRALLPSPVLSPKPDLSKGLRTWRQSGFVSPRTLGPPRCGGIRYATGCTSEGGYIVLMGR